MYFVALNYDIGRGAKPSCIALAALCYVIQASETFHNVEFRDALLQGLEDQEDLFSGTERLL